MNHMNRSQDGAYIDQNGNAYYYDQKGAVYYYDQNGNPFYYDQNGYPYYYDQNGEPYYYDQSGVPHYYNQQHVTPVIQNNIEVRLPKKHNGIKALIITLLIFTVLFVGVGFAVKFLVPGPVEATQGFITAYNNLDMNKMISYCEEKDRKTYEAKMGLLGLAGDALTGLPFSGLMDSFIELAPELVGEEALPHIEILEIQDVTYYYDSEGTKQASNIFGFFDLNKLWCNKAVLWVNVKSDTESGVEEFVLVREGFGQWKISSETSGGGDIFGLKGLIGNY